VPSDAAHRQIAARIRELARRRRWSQNQLADFAGISRAQLSRILTCQQSPTVMTLGKIAAALDVGLRDLLPPTA
jgi:transcriptional regulator with XRE-family HTH domain